MKKITIITDWGGAYGSGHIQRMASLSLALGGVPGIETVIVNAKKTLPFRNDGSFMLRDRPFPCSDLIIRDMRDSSRDEITGLRKKAPVLVIDDIGPGRAGADHVLDLLPFPGQDHVPESPCSGCFLYGHTFMESLESMGASVFTRDIDVVVYAGFDPAEGDGAFFTSLVPHGCRAVILGGKERVFLNAGDGIDCQGMKYAELLLRAKVFVSHFGISLYEARLCGCSVIAVNPTEYHSRLADMVIESVVDVNAGVRGELDAGDVQNACSKVLDYGKYRETGTAHVLARARGAIDSCRDYILSLII